MIPPEAPLASPEGFESHSEVTAGDWFQAVFADILNSPYVSYESRINGKGAAPWRIPFSEIPRRAITNAAHKLYFTPAVFRDGEGMDHEDIAFDPVRVIDLDRPKGSPCATTRHVELLASVLVDAAFLKSNGVQIFLRSSERWENEAPMLPVIGRYLAKMVDPLFYDATCHLKLDGTVGNHRNHAFRSPWGSCDAGAVRCWLPVAGRLSTVREVFDRLGLSLPVKSEDAGLVEPAPADPIPVDEENSTTPTNPTRGSGGTRGGSFEANYVEFAQIRQLLGDLLKQGVPRSEAEAQIAAMRWEHHSRAHLKKTLPTVRPKGGGSEDGKWLSDEEWKKVAADLKELTFRLGPCSNKRAYYQQTRTVRATRAWSFESLYYYDLTCDEAIAAFMAWQECEKIRQLSIDAIGMDAVVEDLRRCWETFNAAGYADKPFANLPKVSPRTVAMVGRRADALGKFGLGDLRKGLSLSPTQTRAALGELCVLGRIVPSGKNKGRVYRVVERIEKRDETERGNPTVALISDAPKVVLPAPTPPPATGWVADPENPSFPPREVYQDRQLWKRQNEIKEIFRLLPLRALKARWRKVVKICCDAPGNCPEQWERDRLKEIIDDLESEKNAAKKQAKKGKKRTSRERFHAQTRYIEDIERKCLAAGEDFTDEDWKDMRDFMRVDFSRFADTEAQKRATERELERQAGMLDYFQGRIDGGFDGPLGPGETLASRLHRFDAGKMERKEEARARGKAT
ncbi:MAG: hypothetical protein D4R65_05985 [Verrucomicrobiaceae bacterium]|nr:MAG: hypothetical protein D4R65_05985 [Verrucomicrobiaceae bacterium]